MDRSQFSITREVSEDRAVLRLSGELDMANTDQLLSQANDGPPLAELTVDLRDLTFIDSSGLSTLLKLSKSLCGQDCRLRLVPGPTNVQRVFEISGLTEHFTWVELAEPTT